MRQVKDSDVLLAGLPGALRWQPVVTSWAADGSLLADNIPVSRGSITVDMTTDTLRSLSLVVPRSLGFEWSPRGNPAHPLACCGQRLDVAVIVSIDSIGKSWRIQQGRFLITSWEDTISTVTVTGTGLLQLAKDSTVATVMQPAAGDTFGSFARRICPAGLAVEIDPGLVDRAVPGSAVSNAGRLDALTELAAAWPSVLLDNDYGQALYVPPLPDIPVPVLSFTDGQRGTVVTAPSLDQRDGRYNMVRARSSAAGFENVYAEASQTSGPYSVATYGQVVQEYSTPLCTTVTQLTACAKSVLSRSVVTPQPVTVTAASNPLVQVADPVSVNYDGVTVTGYVTACTMPLTYADGDMTLTVGTASSVADVDASDGGDL